MLYAVKEVPQKILQTPDTLFAFYYQGTHHRFQIAFFLFQIAF